jgi:argininosuccinate lyase
MLVDDIRGSLAHVTMLGEVGILSDLDAGALVEALGQVRDEAERGTFSFAETDEDVHGAVERRVIEIAGPVGGKLHTGRSRNDQVATDLRLHLSRQGRDRIAEIRRFVGVIVDKAEAVGETVIPSFTHHQQAQAVPLAHHLLAYAWMLLRDAERFGDALGRIEQSPLGAGASGGSMFPLDPAISTRELGWDHHFENSMDAVASRDFVAEYGFCLAQTMTHLSRLSEELILWTTTEFGWATYGDSYTTGSSAMPQKKNPDIAELARGRSARVIAASNALLVLQKGLSLTYFRDLQEDKEIVFEADDIVGGTLEALGALLKSAEFDPPPPGSWVTALDLAETLALRGVPFREAHHAVGVVVATVARSGRGLAEATIGDLIACDERFIPADLDVLDPVTSVRARKSRGGGSFESVRGQIAELRDRLG